MLAFERSLALGLRYLETDVRATADGVAVAFHDATLSRVTGAPGKVARHTYADVRRLRVQGQEPIPTIEELLGTFPDASVTIDIKDRAAIAPTIAAIARTRSAHRVCLAGAWDAWLRPFPEAFGAAVTTALGWRALSTLIACARAGVKPPRGIATGRYAHVAWELGGQALMSQPLVARRLVSMAGDLGIHVVTWTLNSATAMNTALDLGVRGVITDRSDRLREVLIERGAWTPMSPAASGAPGAGASAAVAGASGAGASASGAGASAAVAAVAVAVAAGASAAAPQSAPAPGMHPRQKHLAG